MQYTYDPMNRLTKRFTLGQNDTITLSYDPRFLDRMRDAKGQVFRTQSDASGLVDTVFDPADTAQRFTSYRYNRDGMLTSWTNRRGQRVDLTYDALHRPLLKRGVNTSSDSIFYSSDRRVLVGANSVSRDSIFVAPSSWVDSVVTRFASGKRFRYFYGHNSNLMLDSIGISSTTNIVFPMQHLSYDTKLLALDTLRFGTDTVSVSYNNALRTQTVRWGAGLSETLFYTTDGQVFQSFFSTPVIDSAIWRAYSRDSAGRIASMTTMDRDSLLLGGVWHHYTFAQHDFSYDGLARLSSDSTLFGTSCTQDSTGERCASQVGPLLSLAYDPASNVQVRDSASSQGAKVDSASYAIGNRLMAAGWLGLSYQSDSDGNIRRKYGATTDIRYGWSADNRLVGDTVAATGATIGYAYNAFGMLARRDRGGVPDRYYLWSLGELSVELDGTDTSRISEYAYAPQQGSTAPFALVTGRTSIALTRNLMQDALGSVIGVTTGTSVAQRREYDRWGNRMLQSGAVGDMTRLGWKALLFEGDSTQLYYARNRWYDPATGRFVNEDPEGLDGGGNQYNYGDDDHVNAQDPLGTYSFYAPPCGGLLCRWTIPGRPGFANQQQPSDGFANSDTCAKLRTIISKKLKTLKRRLHNMDNHHGRGTFDHGHWVQVTGFNNGVTNDLADYDKNKCNDDNDDAHRQFAGDYANAKKWITKPIITPPDVPKPGYIYPTIATPDIRSVQQAAPAVGVAAIFGAIALWGSRIATIIAAF